MTSIAADTRMGAVTLDVADVDLVTRFYRDGVGLTVLAEQPGGLADWLADMTLLRDDLAAKG